ncbi:hypothetical protein SCLARK_001269 [Spiroplasma clarkii]|uniref:Lipoprotein n=1 Tax=Spiroplasma clarkii TaxID=2139 RepID=A0A1Y0L1E5_9MOLU|nr:hypothetical protein [Spiroplasma clarkii]ARU91811.1 hypothetical protein SCLARK_001269 [Spiroplasma clarkii]ATX71175.1 hypothetical protein SCLAR_v1c08670 [Spiroplasma clarkii]
MKKLLTYFGIFGITITAPTTVVSCHFGEEIRTPSDLSKFTESDFVPTIINWLKSETGPTATTMYSDVKNVILNYLKANSITINDFDLTVLIEANSQVLPKDNTEVDLNHDGENNFTIKAWVPSFITAVSNSIDVKIEKIKINFLSINDYFAELNKLKFSDFNKGIRNLEKVSGEELAIMFTNMTNSILGNKPYEINNPLRGVDYSFEILTKNNNVIDNQMTFDLKTSGLKELNISLKLNDWSINIWDSQMINLIISIDDQGDIIFVNEDSL